MPELVSNGPQIPARLMNEVDADTVVFFCGAGISAGASSGLPDFSKLVDDIYKQHRLAPDAVEREALHLDAKDSPLWRPQLDKVLGLLERPERLGPSVLRRTVIKLLSKRRRGELIVHKALISLSRANRGGRMTHPTRSARHAFQSEVGRAGEHPGPGPILLPFFHRLRSSFDLRTT